MLFDTLLDLTQRMRHAIEQGQVEAAQTLAKERQACLTALGNNTCPAELAQRLIEADSALQQAARTEREKLRHALLTNPVSPRVTAVQPLAQFLNKAA